MTTKQLHCTKRWAKKLNTAEKLPPYNANNIRYNNTVHVKGG